MLQISGLTKRYGARYAVKGVSFSADKGDVLGFLGQNGAGKSTTMNMITGYISASSGTVTLDGLDILKQPARFKRLVGYLPEVPPLYPEMTVREYLHFVCEIKEVKKSRVGEHISQVSEMVYLQNHLPRLIKNLSKGYRQRLGIAQALIGDPPLIILDEPTSGLDPKQILEMHELIRFLGKNHTVILSSHILSDISDVCNRAVVIHRGEIVADDTLESLMSGVKSRVSRLLLRVGAAGDEALSALKGIDGVINIESAPCAEPGGCDFTVTVKPDCDIRREINQRLNGANLPILMMRPAIDNLEDAFLYLTGSEEADA